MDGSSRTPEQGQLLVEMQAVIRSIEAGGDKDREISQARELIEKADKLGLPEESYADLRRIVAAHGGA